MYLRILFQTAPNYDPLFNTMSMGSFPAPAKHHPPPPVGVPVDDWEVSPSDIVVDESLGEGAFGEVYKGFLKGPLTCNKVKPSYRNAVHVGVAIKLLKGRVVF